MGLDASPQASGIRARSAKTRKNRVLGFKTAENSQKQPKNGLKTPFLGKKCLIRSSRSLRPVSSILFDVELLFHRIEDLVVSFGLFFLLGQQLFIASKLFFLSFCNLYPDFLLPFLFLH